MEILFFLLQVLALPLLSPLAVGIIRKLKARMQNRVGATVLQPYYDLWKLFHKDEVISSDASWVFRFSPYLIFAVTLVIGASVPLITTVAPALFGEMTAAASVSLSFLQTGDFIMIIYLFALATFFLALAGMDTGSGFGGFGSSREMTMAALAEGGLFFFAPGCFRDCPDGECPQYGREFAICPFPVVYPTSGGFHCFFHCAFGRKFSFPG